MPPIVPTLINLFPDNTQVIEVDGLQDEISGAFLNSATVTATLLDQRGVADAVLQNIPMAYLPGTNGNYQGVVPATFNAALGSGYKLVIHAVQGAVEALWTIPALVRVRPQ